MGSLRIFISMILALPMYMILVDTGYYWGYIVVLPLQILAGLNYPIFTKKEQERTMKRRREL